MPSNKVLALAGSTRKDSYNQRLLDIAAEGARQAGAEVTVLRLVDYPLPIFDEDFERESGTPDSARQLQSIFMDHAGLLIASPEYNSSISPLLKNVIDWVSRPIPDHPPLAAYRGKFAALVAASPGALGGLRGLVHVRAILGNIGVTVLPDQFALSKAHEAFDAEGRLVNENQDSAARKIGQALAEMLARLK